MLWVMRLNCVTALRKWKLRDNLRGTADTLLSWELESKTGAQRHGSLRSPAASKEAPSASWAGGKHRRGWNDAPEGNRSKLPVKTGPALTLYDVAKICHFVIMNKFLKGLYSFP